MTTITIDTNQPFSFSFAKRNGILLAQNSEVLVHHNPLTQLLLLELRRTLKKTFRLHLISQENFEKLLTQTYEIKAQHAMQVMEGMEEDLDLNQLVNTLPKPQDLLETENDAPIIRLLNALLSQAIKQNASDIHIETFEETFLVRFRIDGVLREVLQPQRVLAPFIISRIKIMAKLDIAEKRLPQDGRITLRIAGRQVDVRVSTLPASHGERAVLRILDKKSAQLNLAHLGMDNTTLTLLHNVLTKPHGIILVTGPTGSGKTTTLYASLTRLNDNSRNILTVEDPIEYDLTGIGQTQVNLKVDMTFARGLRAILRQDPDVVMIGEIRDLETAQIAVQASLTGHLVLSTLHTNTALGAITRLQDMGVESFLLSSSLIAIMAQRLVRILCNQCKQAKPATLTEMQALQINDIENPPILFHPVGCEDCQHTGFKGRTGIYELIMIDDTLRTMIHEHAHEQQLEQHVRTRFPSMLQDGIRQVLAGVTTLEEAARVVAFT